MLDSQVCRYLTGNGVPGMQFGMAQGDLAGDMITLWQQVKELEDERQMAGLQVNQHETAAFETLTCEVWDLEHWVENPSVNMGS